MKNDTIVAISTPPGIGAISVIRLSGNDAFTIVNVIFKGQNLISVPSHTIHYGHIIDGTQILDEVLVSVFKEPNSFTSENVVEIGCHGGAYVSHKILSLLIKEGARLAEKGEFTERAYLSGRIDLTQAESIMDIIESRSDIALKLANQGLAGHIKALIEKLRNNLMNIIAHIEVNIDYPEYDDVAELTSNVILPEIVSLMSSLQSILAKSDEGRLIREGIKTAIIGRPNVGKSSLLNALLKEDKAIVTNIHGTTRDIVEGYVNIGGITLHLLDTAGIRKSEDTVEKIGIDKAKEALASAELILFVLDNNQPLSDEDQSLLSMTDNKKRIIIVNKIDLENKIGTRFSDAILISALNKTNIELIEDRIKSIFFSGELSLDRTTYIANSRHIGLVKGAYKALEDAETAARNFMPIDIIEIDIKNAHTLLGDIIGDTQSPSLLDELFSRFCLGK